MASITTVLTILAKTRLTLSKPEVQHKHRAW